jgi:hypothetical protein
MVHLSVLSVARKDTRTLLLLLLLLLALLLLLLGRPTNERPRTSGTVSTIPRRAAACTRGSTCRRSRSNSTRWSKRSTQGPITHRSSKRTTKGQRSNSSSLRAELYASKHCFCTPRRSPLEEGRVRWLKPLLPLRRPVQRMLLLQSLMDAAQRRNHRQDGLNQTLHISSRSTMLLLGSHGQHQRCTTLTQRRRRRVQRIPPLLWLDATQTKNHRQQQSRLKNQRLRSSCSRRRRMLGSHRAQCQQRSTTLAAVCRRRVQKRRRRRPYQSHSLPFATATPTTRTLRIAVSRSVAVLVPTLH